MKIDFSQKLMDLAGQPMKKDEKEDATLSSVCVEALLLPREEDKNLDMGEKLKRGRLAERLYNATEAEVSVEEINLLQQLVSKSYGVLVVLRAHSLLEGK